MDAERRESSSTGRGSLEHFSWPTGETILSRLLGRLLPQPGYNEETPLILSANRQLNRLVPVRTVPRFVPQPLVQTDPVSRLAGFLQRFFRLKPRFEPEPVPMGPLNGAVLPPGMIPPEENPFRTILPVGAFRRFASELDRIDLAAVVFNREDALYLLEMLPDTVQVFDRTDRQIDLLLSTAALGVENPKQVRLVVSAVFPEAFPTTVLYETCSEENWSRLTQYAARKGLKLRPSGLYGSSGPVSLPTLESPWERLGLAPVPPEMLGGDVSFVQNRANIPVLITESEIRGDMHLHTDNSDGTGSIEKMTEEAIRRGLEYIALTDHTERCIAGSGMDAARIRQYWRRIDRLNQRLAASGQPFRVLKGVEVDILSDGMLDIDDDLLAHSDWIMASCHFELGLSQKAMHQRIERALANPYVCALSHPTGRTIGSDFLPAIDPEFLVKTAAKNGKFLELNSQPRRLDMNEQLCRRAKEYGVKIVISTDSHAPEQMQYIRYGIQTARAAGLTSRDVVNTLTLPQLRAERQKMLDRREWELFPRRGS